LFLFSSYKIEIFINDNFLHINMTSLTYREPLFRSKLWATDKPFKLKRGHSEGLSDLSQLAKYANRESAWIYTHNDSVWYNIVLRFLGEHEGLNGTHSGGVLTYEFDLSSIDGQVTHYHTHPKRLLEKRVEKEATQARNLGEDISTTELERLQKILLKGAYLESVFPSDGDIDMYIGMLDDGPQNTDFGIVSTFFSNHITLVSSQSRIDTVQRYRRMLSNIRESFDFNYWVQTPVDQLAMEYCERLNQNEIGLKMKLSE